jgi:hypothetical protein
MKTIALAAALLLLPGCLLVAGAAIGDGIVYTTGEDTAEVRVEVNPAAAFAAAREEFIARGQVETSDADAGTLAGKIGTSNVKVTVWGEAKEGTSRVSVKARTNADLGPDMETARTLSVAIVKRTR